MFCPACGQQLQPNQQTCPKCGRAVAGTIPTTPMQPQTYPPMPVPFAQTRVERHLQTLGILWLVYAGWLLITWAFAATFMAGFFGSMAHHPWGPMGHGPFGNGFPFAGIPWLIPFITVILVLRSALGILTGIALLRRESWGRTLAIVVGILALLKPLTGTLLGIYTLWVLLPAASAHEYDQISI
jgi:hypothetical protein